MVAGMEPGVVVSDGAWTRTLARIIPLERLPISTRPVEPDSAGDLPEKPSGANSFRMVILADTAGADAARLVALARRIVAIDADLVVHLGGHARDGEEWTQLRETLVEGLRAAGIPLLSAVSPTDLELGPEVRRPLGKAGEQLELSDGARFPERWDRVRIARQALHLLESRKLDLSGFVSARFPFNDAQRAYESIRDEPGTYMKAVLTYDP